MANAQTLSFFLNDSVFLEKQALRFKIDVYKEIIMSEEFHNDKKCNLVAIHPNSVRTERLIMSQYYMEEIPDTLSVPMLRNELPENYLVYSLVNPFIYSNTGRSFSEQLFDSDRLYCPPYDRYYLCQDKYDIIKIYQPLDRWAGVYRGFLNNSWIYEVTIPVKYEIMDSYDMMEEQYFLFKIKLDYTTGSTDLIKKVIKEEY